MRSLLSFMCVSAVAGGLLVAACGNGTQVFGFEDEGALCVHSNEDGRLHTSVQFPPCLSSSCDHALETGCAIEVSGDEIIVTSSGTFDAGAAQVRYRKG